MAISLRPHLLSSDIILNLRDAGNVGPSATKVYSPPAVKAGPFASTSQDPKQSAAGISASASNKESDEFDEFDPRGSMPGTELVLKFLQDLSVRFFG